MKWCPMKIPSDQIAGFRARLPKYWRTALKIGWAWVLMISVINLANQDIGRKSKKSKTFYFLINLVQNLEVLLYFLIIVYLCAFGEKSKLTVAFELGLSFLSFEKLIEVSVFKKSLIFLKSSNSLIWFSNFKQGLYLDTLKEASPSINPPNH